jgi:hypothetical protein
MTSKVLLQVKELPYAKFGQTSQKAAGNNDYLDYGIKWQVFSQISCNKFYPCREQIGTLCTDDKIEQESMKKSNYDGINIYG